MKVAAIAAAILAAFALASYAVIDARARAKDQRQVVCLEIEKLKAANREKARETFNRLDQNLKLLKLKKTPEIVDAARKNRDAELRRFAARSC